jgi:hypothetical protein
VSHALPLLKDTLCSLDQVAQVVELHGSINATPEFEEHARVLDGASDLLAASSVQWACMLVPSSV